MTVSFHMRLSQPVFLIGKRVLRILLAVAF
jgi:hypothetical protein